MKVETEDEVEEESLRLAIYTEIDTGLIYQAQLFNDFVLFRPITIGFDVETRKMGLAEFSDKYAEFQGNTDLLYDYLNGSEDYQPLEYVFN